MLDLVAADLMQEQKVWEDMMATDAAEKDASRWGRKRLCHMSEQEDKVEAEVDVTEGDTVQMELTTRAGLRGGPARVDNEYPRAR